MAKQSQPETEQSISVRRYSIQLQPNPAALPTSETTTTGDEDTREPSLDAERIGHKFQTILQMLWKYMHGIGAAAEATTSTNLAAFVALIKDISDRKRHANTQDIPLATLKWECEGEDQSTNERKTLRLTEPVYDRRHLDKILKFQQCHDIALRILNETAIQQMVNSWEQLLADLYEWQLLSNPLA